MSWEQVECVKCGQPMGDHAGLFVEGKPWHTACHYNVITVRLAAAEAERDEYKRLWKDACRVKDVRRVEAKGGEMSDLPEVIDFQGARWVRLDVVREREQRLAAAEARLKQADRLAYEVASSALSHRDQSGVLHSLLNYLNVGGVDGPKTAHEWMGRYTEANRGSE